MQEHVGEEGSENGDPQLIQIAYLREPDIVRNHSVPVYERFSLLVIEHKNLKNKNNGINDDQYPVYERDTSGRNGIA
jgi:hypothetical protein